jgi:hypothetical protein
VEVTASDIRLRKAILVHHLRRSPEAGPV